MLLSAATLAGTVTDDGLPAPSLTHQWSKVSGPGTVTFANAATASTTATFSVAGTYVLTLAASDGALSSSDSVTVTVTSNTTTTTFSSSLNKRNPSRTFSVMVGSGALRATPTFSTKLTNAQLKVELFDTSGKSLGFVTGSSGTALTSTVVAGRYNLVVTGSYVSFQLSVTHSLP